MQKPRVAPENRPSVISAILPPMPWPVSAAVVESISRMPGPPLRALVADHDDLAFLVGALLDRLEGVLFAVEAAGRTGELQVRHARDFHDRAFWREIALQTDHTAGDGDRLVGRPHHVLVRIPFHAFEVFGDRPAGDGHDSRRAE